MQFTLRATQSPGLHPQLQWIIYSERTQSFVVGDETRALAIPTEAPGTHSSLAGTVADTGAVATHPCNLPVPLSVYEEWSSLPWHGFKFLTYSEYDHARDDAGLPVGDLLRTIVFGPDYGHYVLHPPTGAVLRLRSGSIGMLHRDATGFSLLEKTNTRGRAALAFAAHPVEGLVAYGDNAGTFHVQRFTTDGFGKASKIATKERKASRLEFIQGGRGLAIGGMGYLETYSYEGNKFSPRHQLSLPVRDFLWLDEGRVVLVNQGLHGLSAYRYDDAGFSKRGEIKPGGSVQQMAASTSLKYLAVTEQDSGAVSIFEMTDD